MAGLPKSRPQEPIGRDLGARAEPAAASPAPRLGLRAKPGGDGRIGALVRAVRSWLERRAEWTPQSASQAAAAKPTHLVPPSSPGRTPKVVFVATFGLCGDELERAVQITLEAQPAEEVVPVFLTDASDFEAFRRCGAIFEHWPSPPNLPSVAETWPDFEHRRLQLLQAKWRPVRVVALGAGSTAKLDEIRARPTWES